MTATEGEYSDKTFHWPHFLSATTGVFFFVGRPIKSLFSCWWLLPVWLTGCHRHPSGGGGGIELKRRIAALLKDYGKMLTRKTYVLTDFGFSECHDDQSCSDSDSLGRMNFILTICKFQVPHVLLEAPHQGTARRILVLQTLCWAIPCGENEKERIREREAKEEEKVLIKLF